MKVDLSKIEIEILHEILCTGDIEDYAREQLEEGYWTKTDFEVYNDLREMVDLEPLESWEREEDVD